MKKIYLLFTLLVMVIAMTGCEQANSPKGVARQAVEALQTENYDKLIDLMGDQDGNALDPQAVALYKSVFGTKLKKKNLEKIVSYKILDQTLSDDGTEATVTFEMMYEKRGAHNENLKLKKGSDGIWRLSKTK